jgi:hypothetical protein
MPARDARLLLFMWLMVDATFILLHVLFEFTQSFNHEFFDILYDRSGGEAMQYVKEMWIALAFLGIAVRRRSGHYVPWAIVFALFLIDDLFQIRELQGRDLAIALNYPELLGLRQADLGELTILAIAALIFLPALGASLYWGSAQFRTFSTRLVALVTALAVFGVVLDMVQIVVTDPLWDSIVGIVEDGGEMVVMSIIAAFALISLGLARRGSSIESPTLALDEDQEPTPTRNHLGRTRSSLRR